MRIRVIDSFTDKPFAGNPAAVCLLEHDSWPDEGWMQQVAAEMHHSETAFAHPLGLGESDADWALRWFTPEVETNLCGHGTLATAHALHNDGAIDGTVRFRSRSGILIARVAADGTVTLDFPAAPPTEAPVPDGLADALGVKLEAGYRTGALGDVLTVAPDERAVREMTPDLAAVAEVGNGNDFRGVIVTAAAEGGNYDFVSRFFSPHQGIPEDPVTGSAHTALAPYWSARLGRDELIGYQASARGGFVRTTHAGDRVLLAGRAVTVLDGTLNV